MLEIKALADELGATTAIFDQELSGAQVRNLEETLDLKIIDRTQLILDILQDARRRERGSFKLSLLSLATCCRVYRDMARTSRVSAAVSARVDRVRRSWRRIDDIFATASLTSRRCSRR